MSFDLIRDRHLLAEREWREALESGDEKAIATTRAALETALIAYTRAKLDAKAERLAQGRARRASSEPDQSAAAIRQRAAVKAQEGGG